MDAERVMQEENEYWEMVATGSIQLDDHFAEFIKGNNASGAVSIPMESIHTPDGGLIVKAKIPSGAKKDDVLVMIHKGMLIVKGERPLKWKLANAVCVPVHCNVDKIGAKLRDGFLEIIINVEDSKVYKPRPFCTIINVED